MPGELTAPELFPLQLSGGRSAESLEDLLFAILEATDSQTKSVRMRDGEDLRDFEMSCDALNYWRACWRLREEIAATDQSELGDIPERLGAMICARREYDSDEFRFALAATSERARSPFGLDPLQLALVRSQRRPIKLLVSDLAESRVATEIAGIARQLQEDLGPDAAILLPVEQLRILLQRRKVVVSGALMRLVEVGILHVADMKYHTSRAREFRFSGVEGIHYRFQDGATS